MSSDLFAAFGASEEAPSQNTHEIKWPTEVDPSPSIKNTAGRPNSSEILWQADQSGHGVLFDASTAEVEDEDEFGDFEDVDGQDIEKSGATSVPNQISAAPVVKQQPPHHGLIDLLGLDDDIPPPASDPIIKDQNKAQNSGGLLPTPVEADDWGEFEDFGNDTQTKTVISAPALAVPVSNPATAIKNDDWEPFEDWNPDEILPSKTSKGQSSHENPFTQTSPAQGRTDLDFYHEEAEPRPMNVPPPTILLQLLPRVFETLRETAISITKDPEADPIPIAAAIILAFNVSARIIAGRFLRWKRDQILAQSTKIGPSGRSGGMKLTAIDKHESIKEEREAAEVSDSWSKHIHMFSAAVSRAGIQKPWMQLNTKTTPRPSPGFGTIAAVNACALCGVKRDERIAGVDFDADDIFGEYWTEHWGHTDCKVFWAGYKDILDQR